MPGEDGVPLWELRFPGRRQFELDELTENHVDFLILKSDPLTLKVSWKLSSGDDVELKIEYPDSYPFTRPHAWLLSDLKQTPERHVEPIGKNICLLGRESRQWAPDLTLHRLLNSQLERALAGDPDEDPQAEPAEVWWNSSIVAPGSYCLVDSEWSLGAENRGTLTVKFCTSKIAIPDSPGHFAPIFKGFVSEVRDENSNVLARWDSALPVELRAPGKSWDIPWSRSDKPLLPTKKLNQKFQEIGSLDRGLIEQNDAHQFLTGISVKMFAAVYPMEVQFGKIGDGWLFGMLYGSKRSFDRGTKKADRSANILVVPTLRAGKTDLGVRVPMVKTLQNKAIAVVGIGAIGSKVSIELARNQCAELMLIDHDEVDPGNTVRWELGTSAWSKRKAESITTHIQTEYPLCRCNAIDAQIGEAAKESDSSRTGAVLDAIKRCDIVIDASASFGVQSYLHRLCTELSKPMISVYGSTNLQGGAVVLFAPNNACPNCLEYHWHEKSLPSPMGMGDESVLAQPVGCADRTFTGSSVDLGELSLQAIRACVKALDTGLDKSVFQILTFEEDQFGCRLPKWDSYELVPHSQCCSELLSNDD